MATKQLALWEVRIGYEEKNGNMIHNWSKKTVVAPSAKEAIEKTKFKAREFLDGVIHIRDIDVK